MSKATVTVQFVNAKKDGKPTGSIKTSDGEFYSVFPDKLSLFKANGVYEIEYSEKNGTGQYADRVFKTVTKVLSVQESAPKSSAATSNGATAPAKWGDVSEITAERMFVSVYGEAYIKAGLVPLGVQPVAEMVEILREAFRLTLGHKPKIDPDMNESLPY